MVEKYGNEFSFLRIYQDIAKENSTDQEVESLFNSLYNSSDGTIVEKKFKDALYGDRLSKIIAIDALAHEIHKGNIALLKHFYDDADPEIFKAFLDDLAGLEISSDVRKINRGYFTSLLSKDGVIDLSKQAGRTTKEDILPGIKEYENLYKANLASPAEILTLARYYPENEEYRVATLKLGLEKEENEPMVVGGPASVEMVDKEGHLITIKALEKAFDLFMKNFRERNVNVLHSDVTVGWVLPAYINKNLEIFKSEVDPNSGLWVISELRKDINVAKKTAEEIQNGRLKSYSIAGSATDSEMIQKGAQLIKQVNDLQLAEITLCVHPSTEVLTKDGFKFAKNIKVGDLVQTDKYRWMEVKEVFVREASEDVFRVVTKSGEAILTGNHKVKVLVERAAKWKQNKYEWIEAKDLKLGIIVNSPYNGIGTHASIISIEKFPYSGRVYNFEVEQDHTYATRAMMVKNCERGMNPGAHFDILKSDDKNIIKEEIAMSEENVSKQVDEKLSKEEVNYREADDEDVEKRNFCASCVFFEVDRFGNEKHGCELIDGEIEPFDLCDLYREERGVEIEEEDEDEDLEESIEDHELKPDEENLILNSEDLPIINVDDTEENADWLHSMRRKNKKEDYDEEEKEDTNPYDAEPSDKSGIDVKKSANEVLVGWIAKQMDRFKEGEIEKRTKKLKDRSEKNFDMPNDKDTVPSLKDKNKSTNPMKVADDGSE